MKGDRWWQVHLATPGVKGEFTFVVFTDCEHDAVAWALEVYSNAYVVRTEDLGEDNGNAD